MPTRELEDLQAAALQQPGAVRRHAGIKFQCPACAAEGHDAHQDNACLFNDGRWGCAWATDSELSKAHRRAIGVALGAFSNGHHAKLADAYTTTPVGDLRAVVATPLRLPDSAMLGIGRDFADLYSAYLESPRSFLYFSFLTYFGSLIAKKVTLDSELRPEPRLFTVNIGETADTRKSTTLRVTDAFYHSLGAEFEPRVLYGVGSAEGMAAELKERSELLLHFDEFKSFVDKAKAEHSVALPMVSTLFERGEHDNRVKAEKVSVRGASVSLIAACTADTYATMFDTRFFAIGMLNRLFVVTDRATSRIAVPKTVPEREVETLRGRVRELLRAIDARYVRHGLRAVPLPIAPSALARFRAWYEARTGSIFEKRLDTYGHRLMVLLAATTAREVIDDEIVDAVLSLLAYQLDARRECDPVDAQNTIAMLEEKVRRALARGAVGSRDLKRKIHYDRVGIWAWETAISNLIRAGEVVHDHSKDLFALDPASGLSPLLSPPRNGG
jgi:hypothetical protein